MILKRTSGICIPRELENEIFYKNIKDNLTRRFKDYNTSTFTLHNFFVEDSKILKIPRFFPIWDYVSCKIENKFNSGEDIKINHNITLRDELQKNIVSYLLENNRGIIQASPGSGKTVTGVFAVAERKKKTFILVHRDSLADQWKGPGLDKPQGFLAFTDLNESDVVRLTSANFEDALKKPIIICTDQTFISLLRRHRARFLIALNQANIGIFIADEVHTTVGAPTFAECSIHIPTPISFGFSATPYRYDGNSDVIEYHLGEVFEPEGEASVMDARVTIMLLDYGISSSKSRAYVYWGGRFQRARYLNLMKKSEMLMKTSKALLSKFICDNRKIIYVSERIKHIEELFKWAPTSDKSKFIGSEKINVLDKQLTYATPAKIRDGVDIPKKDCLIMSSPISNIEQMAGRIIRISDNKEEPIIIDMVDIGEKEMSKTLFSRVSYYEKKKWKIKYILLNKDGGTREISKDNAIEIIRGE